MGKVTFTPFQRDIFEGIVKNDIMRKSFYFGGGTVLSVFYLQHRLSDDLDFFSSKELDKKMIADFMNRLAIEKKLSVKMTLKETVIWFELQKGNDTLKVDFLNFPYPQIEKGMDYKGVVVDSALDIGANKLLLATLEQNPKDYVDLYFILKEKYTIWDLLHAMEKKYRMQMDLIALGKDFMESNSIEFLPKMVKSLTLKQLHDFFQSKAKELGSRIV